MFARTRCQRLSVLRRHDIVHTSTRVRNVSLQSGVPGTGLFEVVRVALLRTFVGEGNGDFLPVLDLQLAHLPHVVRTMCTLDHPTRRRL